MTSLKPKHLLLVGLCLIALVFFSAGVAAYWQFSADVVKNEYASQQKMTRIVNQSLNRYFEILKFITENAVLDSAFDPEKTTGQDSIRFYKIGARRVRRALEQDGILNILSGPRTMAQATDIPRTSIESWKIFKGLPEYDTNGSLIAKERRTIARNILKSFTDIHYVFEMDPNGDLVFLEPFETQKNVTSFNYGFRDYLHLVKTTRSTAISEGYVSHDQNRTQIITVASPVFDSSGKVAKILAVSVSTATLRERVFRSLRENLNLGDGTTFYLVDRHAHIVASSSGKNLYFPLTGKNEDGNDPGNLRSTGFFKNIDWASDTFEKGNIWERSTKSWLVSSLNQDYSGVYRNLNGVDVFATLYPTSSIIVGSESTNWGILVETPVGQLLAAKTHLSRVFYLSGATLIGILLLLSIITLRHFNRLETKLLEKQAEVGQITSLVSHNIRSPLISMKSLATRLFSISEVDQKIFRNAVSEIEALANRLKQRADKINSDKAATLELLPTSGLNEKRSVQHFPTLVESAIIEKREQIRGKQAVDLIYSGIQNTYDLFALLQPIEFRTILSNLLNNAIEAIEDAKGQVVVSVLQVTGRIRLSIQDNGKGIPKTILPRLGRSGETHGKLEGSGLGLFHAKNVVEKWGGTLLIKSEVGHGTEATIDLPLASPPDWFVPAITISPETNIVVLDDNQSIHDLWEQQFKTSIPYKKIEHLFSGGALRARQQGAVSSNAPTLYLIDFELLGEDKTGLDLIEELNLADRSILVTGRFDEEKIIVRSRWLGVKIIPKPLAEVVPITCAN